jgi:cytochrome c oxidase subunit IV
MSLVSVGAGIVGWAFALLFLLSTLSSLFHGGGVGVFLCGVALVALCAPPGRAFLKSRAGVSIGLVPLVVLCFVLLSIQMTLFTKNAATSDRPVAQTPQAQPSQYQEERQKRLTHFNQNKAAVLAQIAEHVAAGKVQEAEALVNRYTAVVQDVELEAAKKIVTAVKLKEELRGEASLPLERKAAIYRQLAELEPSSEEFRAKAKQFGEEQDTLVRREKIAKGRQELSEIEKRLQEFEKSLRTYYGTAEQLTQAQGLILRLAGLKVQFEDQGTTQDEKIVGKLAQDLGRRADRLQREIYASTLEEGFVKAGLDIKVRVLGTSKDRLQLSYALMSQPLVYRFQNELKLSEKAKTFGFDRLIYTNGFSSDLGSTWTVDLRE